MDIAGRLIGPEHPPYIIAEVSCNHGGELSRALELIDAAKACGADAVKFQAYTADRITIKCDRPEFWIKDGPWDNCNLYQLYKKTETPFEWFPKIKEHAEKIGITWFASVFDRSSIDLMVRLGAPAIKIASFEITDTPLIKYAAKKRKPLIISTGMANSPEMWDAWQAAHAEFPEDDPFDWWPQVALLHCVSGYPTRSEEANLQRMVKLGTGFAAEIGISDHSVGPEVPIAATALGAVIIEKHIAMRGHPITEDTPFSLCEGDFATMVRQVQNIWRATRPWPPAASEDSSRPLRRSLFAIKDIRAREKLTNKNVRSIRPGGGLPSSQIDEIIGRRASRKIERGEPLKWVMVL